MFHKHGIKTKTLNEHIAFNPTKRADSLDTQFASEGKAFLSCFESGHFPAHDYFSMILHDCSSAYRTSAWLSLYRDTVSVESRGHIPFLFLPYIAHLKAANPSLLLREDTGQIFLLFIIPKTWSYAYQKTESMKYRPSAH